MYLKESLTIPHAILNGSCLVVSTAMRRCKANTWLMPGEISFVRGIRRNIPPVTFAVASFLHHSRSMVIGIACAVPPAGQGLLKRVHRQRLSLARLSSGWAA